MSQQTTGWRTRAEQAADRYQEMARRRPLFGLPLTFVARYASRQGLLLASAVAFRMFLWLLPLTLLVAGTLAALASSDSKTPATAAKTAGITGAASQQIVSSLQESHRSWWIAVLAGIFGLLWATRTLARCLSLVNGHIWQVRPKRQPQPQVLLSAGIIGGILVATLAGDTLLAKLDRAIPGGLLLTIGVEAIVTTGAWLAISLRLPDGRRSWLDLVPGAALLGITVAVAHAAARVYLPHKIEHASKLYGALGIATVMLGCLLIVGQIMVSCALVNVMVFDYRHPRPTGPAQPPNEVDLTEPGGPLELDDRTTGRPASSPR
jgi:membrane protein